MFFKTLFPWLINLISMFFFISQTTQNMLSFVGRQQPLVKMLLHSSILTFIILAFHRVNGQSNYASHANNINYIGNGLPEETVLDGKVSDFFRKWTLNLLSISLVFLFHFNMKIMNCQFHSAICVCHVHAECGQLWVIEKSPEILSTIFSNILFSICFR